MAADPRIDMNQRWIQCIDTLKTYALVSSYKQFATSIGIPQQSLTDIRAGRRHVTIEMLYSTRNTYSINPDYIISGKGTMFLDGRVPYSLMPELESHPLAEEDKLIAAVNARLKQVREQLGLSVSEATLKVVPLSSGSLHYAELPTYKLLLNEYVKLAEVYNISLDYLFGHHHNEEALSQNDAVGDIILISTQAAASYPTRYLEPEYYKELPAFSIPLPQLRNATFRAFQVSGASMVPTFHPGSWVIARYQIHQDESIQQDWPYVVVTKEAVLVKRILERKESGMLTLLSDNDEYQPYDVLLEDVLELWRVTADIGFQFSVRPASLLQKVEAIESWMRGLGIENPNRFTLEPIQSATGHNWPTPPSKPTPKQAPSKGRKPKQSGQQ